MQCRAPHAARAQTGKRTMNSEPAPGPPLTAATEPPCSLTSDFTNARPSPNPVGRGATASVACAPAIDASNLFSPVERSKREVAV